MEETEMPRLRWRWKYLTSKRRGAWQKAHLVPDWHRSFHAESKCGRLTSTDWLPLIRKGERVIDYSEDLYCKVCRGLP